MSASSTISPTPTGNASKMRAAAALLATAVAGAGVGALAKVVDAGPMGNVGTDYGLWVLLVALIGAFGPNLLEAAARAAGFMGAAMAAYYAVQAAQFGYFSQNLFVAWFALSLTAVPVLAAASFLARRDGLAAALAAALPVGLLLLEAWSKRHHPEVASETIVVDLVAAALLIAVLSRSGRLQFVRVLAFSVPAALVLGPVHDAAMALVPSS
ncbi:MAG: DUF6518 family protein [Solirubrobacteraceae bacterium]|nr:DUF6518 family protein [Solirubrobacteraceae bacterium]